MEIQPADTIVLWLIRWAAMLVSRYVVGKDGRTPYERKRGRKCRTPTCKFGEQVFYRELAMDKKGIDAPWHEGTWLGHARESNEHGIGTAAGVLRAHSIKRQDNTKQWDADAIRACLLYTSPSPRDS